MLESLSLATLGSLDNGTVGILVDRELSRMIADLDDRAAEDGKERKVTIEVTAVLKDKLVVLQVKAQAKLPPMVSGATVAEVRMAAKNRRTLCFQAANADRPDQATFEEFEKEE
jgi:hypothetical protein